MIDEMLVHLFGEAVFGRLGASRRAQLIARLFFGLLGAGLGLAGAVLFLRRDAAGPVMRAGIAAFFACMGAFWLFNVALGRTWRWPGILTIASLVAVIVARLAFGP
jgi:hypothetical protein